MAGTQLLLLLVEDDRLARDQLARMLAGDGHRCCAVGDAQDAIDHIRHGTFDVIATDWHLRSAGVDINGLELARIVRELGVQTPLFLYSARSWTQRDVARAIDAGVDDYMELPLARFGEFVARIRGLVRRSSGKRPSHKVRSASFEVDVTDHIAFYEGLQIYLTRAQFELLAHFVAHVNEILTYDDLYAFRAGRTHANKIERAHVIQEAVRHLRGRLGVGANHLETVPGVGYRLTELGSP